MNNDTRIEIRLPSSLLTKIDRMRDGRSRSEVIRRSITRTLKSPVSRMELYSKVRERTTSSDYTMEKICEVLESELGIIFVD